MTPHLRRVLVSVLGAILVTLGVILMPLPGPGLLVVLLGMVVLSWEYDWARRRLDTVRSQARVASRMAVASTPRVVLVFTMAAGMVAVAALVLLFPDVPYTSPWMSAGLVVGALFVVGTMVHALRSR